MELIKPPDQDNFGVVGRVSNSCPLPPGEVNIHEELGSLFPTPIQITQVGHQPICEPFEIAGIDYRRPVVPALHAESPKLYQHLIVVAFPKVFFVWLLLLGHLQFPLGFQPPLLFCLLPCKLQKLVDRATEDLDELVHLYNKLRLPRGCQNILHSNGLMPGHCFYKVQEAPGLPD